MTTRKLSVSPFLELASYFLLLAFLNFGATDGGTTNSTAGGDENYPRRGGGGGGGADVAPVPAEAPSSRNCTRTGTADALNIPSNNSGGNIGQGINNNILRVSVSPCSRSIVVGTPTPTPATAPVPVRPLVPLKPTPSKRKTKPIIIYVVVAVLIVAAVLLCSLAFYLFRRKKSKSYRAVLREYFGSEGTTLQSLQFSLATIEYATNKFSPQNRIGRGGFGEVYKGVLPDGREIAVKRLSRGSGQGAPEFKNEVLLIAKLQHRNLVALLGFCLKEHEKILVYEYVPNKSLDYFLFGPQKERVLVWSERYKIIVGIARGILYLHQHSRLKVIHRDLKPSNILLDDEMNPKISDFGMAKMVAISETEGSTNRIVGTYGYMSPEYAMRGQFSEKSDVFSFGVIILEIVTGKKNASDHQDSEYIDYLLSYAWMQWRDENLLEIIDSNMNELSSNSEVIKCIQIGLLCVQANPDARPTMDTIVRYLNNDSVQLPFPREPAFFLYGQVEPTIGAIELGFGQHADTVNQMSISNSFPR